MKDYRSSTAYQPSTRLRPDEDHGAPARDPRKNAPPRICDLPREEMQQVLFARHEARRVAYMRMYRDPPKPSLIARIANRLSRRVRAAGGVG